jgi:hypothetical protein
MNFATLDAERKMIKGDHKFYKILIREFIKFSSSEGLRRVQNLQMNVARTVVTIVSSSKRNRLQAEVVPNSRMPTDALRSFAESMKATTKIITLGDIPEESRGGDEEFYMLMLDGYFLDTPSI